jgi:hypothetical protein
MSNVTGTAGDMGRQTLLPTDVVPDKSSTKTPSALGGTPDSVTVTVIIAPGATARLPRLAPVSVTELIAADASAGTTASKTIAAPAARRAKLHTPRAMAGYAIGATVARQHWTTTGRTGHRGADIGARVLGPVSNSRRWGDIRKPTIVVERAVSLGAAKDTRTGR